MNCSFCCSPALYGYGIRRRPVSSIAAEASLLNSTYGITLIHFVDDDLLFDPEYALGLAEAVHLAVPDALWIMQARCDSVVRAHKYLGKYRKCGCVGVEIGLESAEDAALRGMGKSLRTETTVEAALSLRKAGIERLYLSLAYAPGETTAGPHALLQLLSAIEGGTPWSVPAGLDLLAAVTVFGHLMTPFPGSALGDSANREGISLLGGHSDAYTERINFVPYSWLHDKPLCESRHPSWSHIRELSAFMRDRNLYLPDLILSGAQPIDTPQLAVGAASLCDGITSVIDIHQALAKDNSNISLGDTVGAISVLSAMGLLSPTRASD